MNKEDEKYQEFYDYIIKVLSIAKIGLVFSKDPYALDNYDQLEKLSMKELENFESLKFDKQDIFERAIYPTPSVSVRVCIFNDKDEILLVREANEGRYSVPGGWCDLYDSPIDAAKAESMQEAGANIKNIKLVGIINRTPFKNFPNAPASKTVPEYAIILKAELDGKLESHLYETDDVKFFPVSELPDMSHKVTLDEWKNLINAAKENKTLID
ncbi:MAG: NUDIX domain-containing protein [Bacilli bacterium]